MNKRNIFRKKNNKIKYIIILFIFFLIIIIYQSTYNDKYFTIKEVNHNYYTIPQNKGGVEIPYLDIKILNKENIDTEIISLNNDIFDNSKYTIQIFSSKSIDEINKMKNILRKDDIINRNDVYIAKFNTNLGDYFLLLYKLFENKDNAILECEILKDKTDYECIIIKSENL